MSLDVYLSQKGAAVATQGSGIFIREDGGTKEISREEWDRRHPNTIPVVMSVDESESDTVYSDNITHNLGKMASEAGIYQLLWRPEEIPIKKASELIDPLREGLHRLKSDKERFEKFNPENGWGSYQGLVEFVGRYLDACYENPDAEVSVTT